MSRAPAEGRPEQFLRLQELHAGPVEQKRYDGCRSEMPFTARKEAVTTALLFHLLQNRGMNLC